MARKINLSDALIGALTTLLVGISNSLNEPWHDIVNYCSGFLSVLLVIGSDRILQWREEGSQLRKLKSERNYLRRQHNIAIRKGLSYRASDLWSQILEYNRRIHAELTASVNKDKIK